MVAVVGAQFCSPRASRLTLTMNLTRGGTVTNDASGAVVLRMVVPLFLRFLDRFVLADVAGRPLVSVQRKAFSLYYRAWEAFRGDGNSYNGGQLLFTGRKSTIVQVRTHMDVFLASNIAQEVCDFRIKCGFAERSADVCLGNSSTVIAQIRRRHTSAGVMLGKSTFSVTVSPNVDYVFIAALAVMVNEIHVARRRSIEN